MVNKKRIPKTIAWLLALTMVSMLSIGGVFAVKMYQTEVTNELKSHTVDTEVTEKFDDTDTWDETTTKFTKEVKFTNTGNAPAFVRVAYCQTMNYVDATTGLMTPMDTNIKPAWTSAWTNEWEKGADGWYYYKKLLQPGQSTAAIVDSVSFSGAETSLTVDSYGEKGFTGKGSYEFSFLVETVQASDEAAVNYDAAGATFGRYPVVTGLGASAGTGMAVGTSVTWQNNRPT